MLTEAPQIREPASPRVPTIPTLHLPPVEGVGMSSRSSSPAPGPQAVPRLRLPMPAVLEMTNWELLVGWRAPVADAAQDEVPFLELPPLDDIEAPEVPFIELPPLEAMATDADVPFLDLPLPGAQVEPEELIPELMARVDALDWLEELPTPVEQGMPRVPDLDDITCGGHDAVAMFA